jgi:hypothetical protein
LKSFDKVVVKKNNKTNSDVSVEQIVKPEGHNKNVNSMFCSTTMMKEQIRQEKIINAIIDNDNSDRYNSTIGSQKDRTKRNYSTFDGRTNVIFPKSVKNVTKMQSQLHRYF